MLKFLNVVSRLKRFNEKCKTSTKGKKILYFITNTIYLIIVAGIGLLAYYLLTNMAGSSLGIFLVIIGLGLAIASAVIAVYCIIKFIVILRAALKNNN